jgi:hypothetical protein
MNLRWKNLPIYVRRIAGMGLITVRMGQNLLRSPGRILGENSQTSCARRHRVT